MLFKKLPDDIFRPLVGPNKHLCEELLLHLFQYFSGEDLQYEAIFPRRASVKAVMEELLARKGRTLHVVNEDNDAKGIYGDSSFRTTPDQAAEYFYRRLVDTGWLEEEPDGYNVNVLMPPHANLLLEALVSVAQADRKNYGSTVASINVQLEAIANNPSVHAHAFIEVVRASRDFTRHLQNIIAGLRGFQDVIMRHRSPIMAVSIFFDEFVENLLISDYKSLQAENNPFRHRVKVFQHLLNIEYDKNTMDALTKVYQSDKNISEGQAREKVLNDLHFISNVFHSVDRRLSAIDMYRQRLESRVAEMIRYLDRNVPNLANRSVRLLNTLGPMLEGALDEVDPNLPQPTNWVSLRLVGQNSMFKPRVRRKPAFIELEDEQEISNEKKEQRRLEMEYLQRRSITPAKVGAFIRKQLEGRNSIEAKDIKVETVEDLIAFCFIPYLHQIGGKSMMRKDSFTIRRVEGRLDTPFLECDNFIIERGL